MTHISWFDVYTAACHKFVHLPEGWRCVSARAIGHPADRKGVIAIGAVCPDKTRGPDAVSPNWNRRDKSTERKIGLTFEECAIVRERLFKAAISGANATMGEGA